MCVCVWGGEERRSGGIVGETLLSVSVFVIVFPLFFLFRSRKTYTGLLHLFFFLLSLGFLVEKKKNTDTKTTKKKIHDIPSFFPLGSLACTLDYHTKPPSA